MYIHIHVIITLCTCATFTKSAIYTCTCVLLITWCGTAVINFARMHGLVDGGHVGVSALSSSSYYFYWPPILCGDYFFVGTHVCYVADWSQNTNQKKLYSQMV